MIDFLNLTENKNNCGCSFLGHSMQLLPYQYDEYVFYVGDFTSDIEHIYILDSYGGKTEISFDTHSDYLYLKNIPFDDMNNVILDVELSNSKHLYSDPIKISSHNACKTTRINFKCKETDTMQSISFPLYYYQDKRATELESYYQISTKSNTSYATANPKYKVYKSDFMSIDAINKLNDALILPFVYFNYKRVNLYEAIEIPDLQADEKFAEIMVSVNEYKGIGDNDITPTFYITKEDNNDHIITENNNNNIITE